MVRLLGRARHCRPVYEALLYMVRSISKIGAESREQLPLLFGLSFRAEYRAFSCVITQPLQMRLHVLHGGWGYFGGCRPGEVIQPAI